MKPVTQQSAVELLKLLRESKISPLELANEYIGQIERLNPRLNALVDFDPERVREQVRAAEKSKVPRGPLFGLPVTVKGSISVAGHRCEIGSLINRGNVPAEDATVVSRLAQCGRDHSRYHQQSRISDGVRDRQPSLRPHQQPVEPRLHPRRIERRRVGRHRRRTVVRRPRQRQWRLGPRARALHRYLRVEADTGPNSRERPPAGLRGTILDSGSDWADGAHHGRCCAAVPGALRTGPDRSGQPAYPTTSDIALPT